ncbi:MAG: hypothetical protein JJU29_07270 [Verrucomicrobia bacterium]|nr:hypothetical protein [Verrucomicrobiota bacterium]MCH8512219.1 hypothetical protein [Kiritimatiellia bacterium]
MSWSHIDEQMRSFAPFLRDQFGITPPQSNHLASEIAAEIRMLPRETLDSITEADPISATARLEELRGFQMFMDIVQAFESHPSVTRAQVINQNYVCFVYLGDACFNALRKAAPPGSVTRKCCKFLTDNPVRAFRNSLAHANWTYREDFSGLVFWARKGGDPNESLTRFEVGQNDLNFWQALSRCVAYIAYTLVTETNSEQGERGNSE